MKLGKVDFPAPFVAAARNRELVVFAGAGVSMGKPAALPGFRELAREIADRARENELDIKKMLDGSDRINPDAYLDRLKDQGKDVHALAAAVLSELDVRPSRLHRILLSFYPEPSAVRVVTTNFDRLFEQAAEDAFPQPAPQVYSFPDLPASSDFRGIVHIHGDVTNPRKMVLTAEDFGNAYVVSDTPARKFLEHLLTESALLFIGYSGDDVFFRYLARASSAAGTRQHFAMAKDGEEQAWRELGIQPIPYPVSPAATDFGDALCDGLSLLSEYVGESVVEQRSRIAGLACRSPSELNREQTDLVADAVSDSVRRKFFTRAAASPEWVAWLDERKYLDNLFDSAALSAGDRELAEWLAANFVRDGAGALFALIGRHEGRPHPDFWGLLLWQAGMSAEPPIGRDCLLRWVSLLLSIAPPCSGRAFALDLLFLGERCIENGLTDSVMEIFEMLAAGRLVLAESSFVRHAGEKANLGVEAAFSPVAEQYELGELWGKGLRPKISRIAGRAVPILARNLAKQHQTLCAWSGDGRPWDPASFDRSAIESHAQNDAPESVDIIISAVRDCLQYLAEHDRDAALYWCRQLVEEPAPILRRLAVHTLAELSDESGFGPDEKVDWLLSHCLINDFDTHHEVFRAMRLSYPRASRQRRQALISAILDYQLPNEKDPDGGIAAYTRFNWFHWLHLADPGCSLTRKAKDQVLAKHPEFRPREHPDFEISTGGIAEFVEPHSPWSCDQLLAKPADRWVSKLLERRPEESPLKGSLWEREGLRKRVAEAAERNFGWGADLADALARKKAWASDLWQALLPAWAEADEDEILKRRALRHLSQGELRSEHSAAIADLLYAWARGGKHVNLLADADRIAVELWPVLSRNPEKHLPYTEPSPDWLTSAINCPSGVLAAFWLARSSADGLHGRCREAISAIVQDRSVAGRLGRTVLARSFLVLFHEDEEWTRENLLPFFEFPEDTGARDCEAVWEGFLYRPRIDDRAFSRMEAAFRSVIKRLRSDHCFLQGRLRKQFLRVCARIVMDKHRVPDPLDEWLPSILRNCGARDMAIFIAEIGRSLKEMSGAEQEETWRRWLKEYWQLRRHGAIAGYLTREETTGMFHWLPCLRGTVFSEAVDLAEQTSPVPHLRHGFLFRELDKAGLYREQPEAVAKLLLCLDKAEAPRYAWGEGGKLIRKLLTLGIPAELQSRLEGLAALHDISVLEASAA